MGGVGQVMLLAFRRIGASAGRAVGVIWSVGTSRADQYREYDRDFWKLPKHNPRPTPHNR